MGDCEQRLEKPESGCIYLFSICPLNLLIMVFKILYCYAKGFHFYVSNLSIFKNCI